MSFISGSYEAVLGTFRASGEVVYFAFRVSCFGFFLRVEYFEGETHTTRKKPKKTRNTKRKVYNFGGETRNAKPEIYNFAPEARGRNTKCEMSLKPLHMNQR